MSRNIGGIIISDRVIDEATDMADLSGERVLIWEAAPGKGFSGFILILKSKKNTSPDRLDIKGFSATSGSTPPPLDYVDGSMSGRITGKHSKRNPGDTRYMRPIDSIPNVEIKPFNIVALAGAKVHMTRSQWVKIGKTQGWVKAKDSRDLEKVAVPIMPLIYGAMMLAPYVMPLFTGGDEEKAKEIASDPAALSQMSQQAAQQAVQVKNMLDPLIEHIRGVAKNLGAACQGEVAPAECATQVNSLVEYQNKAKEIQNKSNDIEKMKDMNFVCPLLKEALNLEVCSRRIIKETASLNDSLDYVQQQGWSGAKGGLA